MLRAERGKNVALLPAVYAEYRHESEEMLAGKPVLQALDRRQRILKHVPATKTVSGPLTLPKHAGMA